jgi:hypothetical protein
MTEPRNNTPRTNASLLCRHCNSDQTTHLAAEVNIHLAGLAGLSKPAVLVFPRLIICLQCGFVEFKLEEREMMLLWANTFNDHVA